MKDFDPKNTTNDFDKEFRLNRKKASAIRGKLPSWLLIAAGAAAMGGVVIAKQPSLTPTRAAVNSGTPAAMVVAGDPAAIQAINDAQADPSELEALFTVPSGEPHGTPVLYTNDSQPYSMSLQPLMVDSDGHVVPPSSDQEDTVIYWVEGYPYALTVEPDAAAPKDTVSATDPAVYWIGDQPYSVSLKPLSAKEVSGLSQLEQSSLIRIGEQYYRLVMEAMDPAAVPTAAPEVPTETPVFVTEDDPFSSDVPEETVVPAEQTAATAEPEQPAVAILNGKAYTISASPAYSTPAADADATLTGEGTEEKSVVFELEGRPYEIRLTETDIPAGGVQNAPVIWLDKVPLHVRLEPDVKGDKNAFDVILTPVSDEELPALWKSHFGEEYRDPSAPAEEPTAVPTEIPTEEPGGNWFVNMFNNIFGSGPTATPTPQVTVIPVEPTPTVVKPTATPLVLRVAPTEVPQEPVRLADPDGSAAKGIDPDLVDDETEPTKTVPARPAPTKTPQFIVPVIVEETELPDRSAEAVTGGNTVSAEYTAPTATPIPEELPHTGMADGWNIPSMLIMFAGLILVIIGVRRLRRE